MHAKSRLCSLCHAQESHNLLFCNRCWTCIQRARQAQLDITFMDQVLDFKDVQAREAFIAGFDDGSTVTYSRG